MSASYTYSTMLCASHRHQGASCWRPQITPKKPLATSRLLALYCTLLYSTLLYSTLLYSTLLYSTLLYSILLYSTVHTTHYAPYIVYYRLHGACYISCVVYYVCIMQISHLYCMSQYAKYYMLYSTYPTLCIIPGYLFNTICCIVCSTIASLCHAVAKRSSSL